MSDKDKAIRPERITFYDAKTKEFHLNEKMLRACLKKSAEAGDLAAVQNEMVAAFAQIAERHAQLSGHYIVNMIGFLVAASAFELNVSCEACFERAIDATRMLTLEEREGEMVLVLDLRSDAEREHDDAADALGNVPPGAGDVVH